MYLDNKKEWVKQRDNLLDRIISSDIPQERKQMVFANRKGLWETPKVYVDGFAYNDGTWLIYKTLRMKGEKLRNKIYCQTKQDVIKQLYSYCCFLKNIGIENALEMYFFVTCHIIYKLIYHKGLWNCSDINIRKIADLVHTVSSKDVYCSRQDPRKYCMDPEIKEGKTKGQVIGLQRKKDKEVIWKGIEELYDETLTNKQNLEKLKENGLDVSERTLQRWKREQRGCQMVCDNTKITQKQPKLQK